MIAKVYSAIPQGYNGAIVEVEGDTNQGLPSLNIVGMANKTIFEARERVRSAIVNSDFTFPHHKITINLAPAELAKEGSHLDLPISLAILVLSGQLLASDLHNRLFVGELSLNGTARPVRGIINIVETAKQAGYSEIFVPQANLAQAKLIDDIKIIGITCLKDLVLHLKGYLDLEKSPKSHQIKLSAHNLSTPSQQNCPNSENTPIVQSTSSFTSKDVVKNTKTPTLDQICGQKFAKRVLSIAIAGHHNLLLKGPPGAGKTMLAKAAFSLLPNPTPSEQIEITKLQSLFQGSASIATTLPFRAPHHSASSAAIIGGGLYAYPGEISLAHRGILFLDELPEYNRTVLESLRQPLEDGFITIARANQHLTYPANFILIATMNPCPCGYFGSRQHQCSCTPQQISNYQKRISGPILDRIDLILNIEPVPQTDLLNVVKTTKTDIKHSKPRNVVKNNKTDIEFIDTKPTTKNVVNNTLTDTDKTSEHHVVKNNITEAIQRQFQRYQSNKYNGELSSKEVGNLITLSKPAQELLITATQRLNLSTRSYFKVLKVAQTIADLDGVTGVEIEQISEALALRHREC